MTVKDYAAENGISVGTARTRLNKMVEEGKATCRRVERETPIKGYGMMPIMVTDYTILDYESMTTEQLLQERASLASTINAVPVGKGIVLSKRVGAIIQELHRRGEQCPVTQD